MRPALDDRGKIGADWDDAVSRVALGCAGDEFPGHSQPLPADGELATDEINVTAFKAEDFTAPQSGVCCEG